MSQFPPPPPEGQQPPGGTPPQPPPQQPPPPPPGGATPPPPPPPPPGPPGGGYPGGGMPPGSPPPGGGYGAVPPAGGRQFSVGDAFGYAWKKFTENVGPILIAMLVFLLIGAVIYGLQYLLQGVTTPETTVVSGENGFVVQRSGGSSFLALLVSLVFGVIGLVWNYLVQAGIARGGLAVTEGRPIVLGELLSFNKLGRIILAAIILGVLTLIGLILCILPGLIVMFFGSYFVYFVLDQDLGAWDSITASFGFVKDNFGNLLLLFILALIITFIGALLCGIGLLVAYPVVWIAHAYAYKVLRGVPVAP